MELNYDLPFFPKYPLVTILWISIGGSVGLISIASVVTVFIVKKKLNK